MIGLFSVLYVDDGAFPFGNIVQLEQGVELVYSHFTDFGLDVHIGREGKPSKMECVFFPPSLASSCDFRYYLIQTREQATISQRNKIRRGSHMRKSV